MKKSDIGAVFSAIDPVTIKRMVGGKGLYYRGYILAVGFPGDILLKADEVSTPRSKRPAPSDGPTTMPRATR